MKTTIVYKPAIITTVKAPQPLKTTGKYVALKVATILLPQALKTMLAIDAILVDMSRVFLFSDDSVMLFSDGSEVISA